MILIAELKFVSTFALKPSNVTHMSGRTLLLPTPYAIKMALIDRMIVRFGFEQSKAIFPAIRDLNIYWSGPSVIGVMQVTERGYRLEKTGNKEQLKIQEYCSYSDSFFLAFEGNQIGIDNDLFQFISMLFYLGRTDSIVNCEFVYRNTDIDYTWHNLCTPINYLEIARGTVQRMDDMKGDISLEDVSTYNLQSRTNTRIQYDIVIPYKLGHVSENFVGYERFV